MDQFPKILAIDDDSMFLAAIKESLENQYKVETVNGGMAAMRSMSQSVPDLILLDYCLPEMSGLELLKIFKRRFNEVPIIMLTAATDADTIIETMKNGATDFVIKSGEDFEMNLRFRINQVVEKLNLLKNNRTLSQENICRAEENRKLISKVTGHTRSYEILGISAETLRLKSTILSIKGSTANVLIGGENGTGKELVARTINQQEDDAGRPFIAVNCAAIATGLFESEFFGHMKGSFTGASERSQGKFLLANGGDLFLDEVGEIPYDMQAKLLRVLQEKTFTPVGGGKEISVNVRVIAASNRDLESEVRNNRFREDLFHRLNQLNVYVPPLRNRKDDILFLAEEFLRRQLPMARFSEATKLKLENYPWPGNIRELHNSIERAVVFAKQSNRPLIKPEQIILSRVDPTQHKIAIPEKLLPGSANDISAEHFDRCMLWIERKYMALGLEMLGGDNEELYKKLAVSRAYYFKRKKLLNERGEAATPRSEEVII